MLSKLIKSQKRLMARRFTSINKNTQSLKDRNPTINAILSADRIARHNKEIEMDLVHVDRREQLLRVEYAKKLGVNAWNVEFKANNVSEAEGLKKQSVLIFDRIDLKDRYKIDQSYDYLLVFNKAIEKLNNTEIWNVDKIKADLFDNNVKNGLEYVEIMTKAEQTLLKENKTHLSDTEVKIINLPVDCSIRELKGILGFSSSQIKKVGRDVFNNVSYITLNFGGKEEADHFISNHSDLYHNGNALKFVNRDNESNEDLPSRTIIIENLDSSVTKKELLLELSKVARVNQIVFPEVYHHGNTIKTSDVLKYIEANKHKFEDDFKIEIIEIDGESQKTFTVYESPNNLSDEIYINKTRGLDYIKSFTMEAFEEVKKLDEEEGFRKLIREKNKLVIYTIKDDYTSDSSPITHKEENDSYISNKLWSRFNDNEKVSKIHNMMKNRIPTYNIRSLTTRNEDNINGNICSLGFTVVEFNSSYEAKKALIAFKSLSRFAQTKVDLWAPGTLFKLVPDLKAKIIQTIEYNKIIRETSLISNNNDPEILIKSEPHINKNHSEAVKFLRKQQLKESLKKSIEDFVQKTYFTDSKNLETKLPGLDELSHHMLREGRSFGETHEIHEYNILKARVGVAYQKGEYKRESIDKMKFILNIEAVK